MLLKGIEKDKIKIESPKQSDYVKIATWNVNSVRARMSALQNWISQNSSDIILLQETKCTDENFPISDINNLGYNVEIFGQKSYNGVAILSKYPIYVELYQLPLYDEQIEDNEARYIEAIIEVNNSIFRVASIYVPNGSSTLMSSEKLEDSKRFKYKMSFFRRLTKRVQEVLKFEDEYVVFGGDYNVALQEIDLHNPDTAAGGVGFHQDEINHLQTIIDLGLVDSYRFKYPDTVAYSWWDYRRNRWADNKGWRIDYLLSSQNIINNTFDCTIHKNTRGVEKASDHVPVEINIKC